MKDTSGLSPDNIFKNAMDINAVARVISRHTAELSNTASNLSETWLVQVADKQNLLYNAVTAGMNEVALDFQEWVNAPSL